MVATRRRRSHRRQSLRRSRNVEVRFSFLLSRDDAEPVVTTSYLESLAILPARTFLSHFLSLLLAAHPDLLVARFAYPPTDSALAKLSTTTDAPDELIFTKLGGMNFLQLTLRSCQGGAGEGIERIKMADGTMKESKGKGKIAWVALLAKYEKELSWLRVPDVKEVRLHIPRLYSR